MRPAILLWIIQNAIRITPELVRPIITCTRITLLSIVTPTSGTMNTAIMPTQVHSLLRRARARVILATSRLLGDPRSPKIQPLVDRRAQHPARDTKTGLDRHGIPKEATRENRFPKMRMPW